MRRFALLGLLAVGALFVLIIASACASGGFSATKDQFIKDTQAQVDYYQVKIDELVEKTKSMTGEARENADEKIGRLKEKQQEAKDQLKVAGVATEDTWHKTKSDLKDVLGDLKAFYRDAVSAVR